MNDRMSDMDALVELAARALHEGTAHPTPWDELPKWMTDEKRSFARAALLAVGLPALLERVEAAESKVRVAAAGEAFHKVAIAERNHAWAQLTRTETERDALAAKVAQLTTELESKP